MDKLYNFPEKLKIKLQEKLGENKLLYITKVGSQLYGTNNPNSDTDYRGIYLPPLNDLILKKDNEHIIISKGNGDKQKNTSEDVDFDLWSLHKFLDLLRKGDTGAFDLLYSMFREDTQLFNSEYTEYIKGFAPVFNTKNTKAFTGYCVAQAAKYGVKGTRYKELTRFYNKDMFPKEELGAGKIGDYFNSWDLSEFEHIKIESGESANRSEMDYINVLGKKFGATITVNEFVSRLKILEQKYGDRSKASTEGTDWKALSHAVRILSQVEELLEDGKMSFPLKELDLVKGIKENHLTTKECKEIIEYKLARIDSLVKESEYPEAIDKNTINDIILDIYYL